MFEMTVYYLKMPWIAPKE